MRVVACLLLTASLLAIQPVPPHTNVYINSMGGFGSYLAAAFRVKAVPMVVVADRRQADFEVVGTAESKEPATAEAVLWNQGGSSERAGVSLINLKTGEVVFAYEYHRGYALFGRKSAAESCAKHLRAAILKGEVDLQSAAVAGGHHAGETTAVPPAEPDSNFGVPPARQLLPVAIASDPPGARIEVENIFAGRAPATIKLQPGEYRVSLTLAGYESWNGTIVVQAGSPAALAAALKK